MRWLCNVIGHTHIDILKIDIEGWEFDTLRAMLSPYLESETPVPFGQLQIEVHAWNKRFHDFLSWWELIEGVGLRPFMSEVRVYLMYTIHPPGLILSISIAQFSLCEL